MPTNYLEKSRRKWRKRGYYVEGLESIVRLGNRTLRTDAFGFADLVAVSPEGELVFLQVTSWSNVSARLRKIQSESTGRGQHACPMRDLAKMLLRNPTVRIVIEGWKLDTKKYRYIDREREVTSEDLTEEIAAELALRELRRSVPKGPASS